jgi:hypothetical protein
MCSVSKHSYVCHNIKEGSTKQEKFITIISTSKYEIQFYTSIPIILTDGISYVGYKDRCYSWAESIFIPRSAINLQIHYVCKTWTLYF